MLKSLQGDLIYLQGDLFLADLSKGDLFLADLSTERFVSSWYCVSAV